MSGAGTAHRAVTSILGFEVLTETAKGEEESLRDKEVRA